MVRTVAFLALAAVHALAIDFSLKGNWKATSAHVWSCEETGRQSFERFDFTIDDAPRSALSGESEEEGDFENGTNNSVNSFVGNACGSREFIFERRLESDIRPGVVLRRTRSRSDGTSSFRHPGSALLAHRGCVL